MPKKTITAQSTDEEIINAINAAGEHRHGWRQHDWPNAGETKAWVTPADIGDSSRTNTALLKRLVALVKGGKLETRRISRKPRFRVIRT